MAELAQILEENDFSRILLNFNNIAKKPSKADIELIIGDNGYSLPLPNSVSFVIQSNNRVHTVRYSKTVDVFYTLLMDIAV